MKTTSVALGPHFEEFVRITISRGRYNNVSEVIRAALRLLEENELKIDSLKEAINEGLESGVAENFEPDRFLKSLKSNRTNG